MTNPMLLMWAIALLLAFGSTHDVVSDVVRDADRTAGPPNMVAVSRPADACIVGTQAADDGAPAYYRIDLVPTRRVPGTHRVRGYSDVTFLPSPFGVAISKTGSYVYQLGLVVEGLPSAPSGAYVAWISTPQLDRVQRLGDLVDGRIDGTVEWNKFLVILTLEPNSEPTDRWTGPVVARGMSRSGMMHTMAGHGPFEDEPCAQYGYY